MKYNVGDKVKIKKLNLDGTYDGFGVTTEMVELSENIATITDKRTTTYDIDIDNGVHNWTDKMFTGKVRMTQTEVLQDSINKLTDVIENVSKERNDTLSKTVEKSLDKINDTVNQRTIYDEVIQEEILKKARDISLQDIEKAIFDDVDNYIRTNFSIIPKKIEIAKDKKMKKIDGIFHEKFEEILKIVDKGVPLMLTGPAGAGKNYTLEQVAKGLGLDFYFTNAITQEYKLTGFIDANGVYQETQFYKAFTKGGLFFLDEVDASIPEALIILNSAIANGYFDFPKGKEKAHKNFRVVCAGNTYGTGADMIYVGRNALDGATLDRFVVINFDYDENVEKQLAYNDDLYNFIKKLRNTIKECSLRYIISMRATINATKLLEIGIPKENIIKNVIIKNMQIDDLNTIINKIPKTTEWETMLQDIVERM